MKRKPILVWLTLASLAWGSYAYSQAAQDSQAENTTSDNEPSAAEANSTKSIAENVIEPVLTATDQTTTKSRGLGDAFKNFQPSEEISADNPVPFPVDI